MQFVSSRSEAKEAMTSLHSSTQGIFGFAIVIIDIQASTSILKKTIAEINATLCKHNILYKPRYVVMSAEIPDKAKI